MSVLFPLSFPAEILKTFPMCEFPERLTELPIEGKSGEVSNLLPRHSRQF